MQSCFWPTPDFRVPTRVFRYKPVSSSMALSVLGIKWRLVIVLSYSCMVANRSKSISVPINVSASHYVRFSVDTLSLVPWWSHPHPCAMQSQQPQGMHGWKIKKRWRDGGRFVVTDRRTLLVCIPRRVNNSGLFAFRVYDTDEDICLLQFRFIFEYRGKMWATWFGVIINDVWFTTVDFCDQWSLWC